MVFMQWGMCQNPGPSTTETFSYEDYMKQCEGFTASKYDPKKWAALFKKAGADYVVMTSKHHDAWPFLTQNTAT